MKVVQDAAVDRLMSLTSVTSMIGTFRGVPAIFSGEPIPPSAVGRYIVVRDAHIDELWETKTPDNPPPDYVATLGNIVEFDIGLYEDQTGDTSELQTLAKLVQMSFNRYRGLTISGYGTLIASATGPIKAPESEQMGNQIDGRIVTVRLTVIQDP